MQYYNLLIIAAGKLSSLDVGVKAINLPADESV